MPFEPDFMNDLVQHVESLWQSKSGPLSNFQEDRDYRPEIENRRPRNQNHKARDFNDVRQGLLEGKRHHMVFLFPGCPRLSYV